MTHDCLPHQVSAQRHLAIRSVGALAAQLAAARAARASAARLEALEGAVLLLVYRAARVEHALRTRCMQVLTTTPRPLPHRYRAARVEHAAGYTERAIGIFQALFEFNLMAPAALEHAPVAARLGSFEAFWEAEAPRVGSMAEDVGVTHGWCHWFAATKAAVSLAPPDTAPPLATRHLPIRDEIRDERVRRTLDADYL